MSDTSAPNLTFLGFSSPLNVSGGARPITFTAGATDDLSGVDHVYVWFTKSLNYGYPNSTLTSNSTLFSIYDFQDSFSDGQSSNTYTITPFNAPGMYTVDHVDVVDKVGNDHTYNTAQLSALGAQTSLTIQGGTADTTGPVLTSLSFNSALNVSGEAQPITFTAGATDDLSGVDHVYVWFTKSLNYGYPNSTLTGNSTLFSIYDFQDSFSDGQSSNTYTITPFNAPGTYTVDHVDVVDKTGNNHTYNTAQLSALGAQTSFTLQGSAADTAKPTLTSLSFNSSLNVNGGARPITFTAGATDDLSGVDHVYVWFTKSLNYRYPNSTLTSNSTLFSIYDFQDSFSDGQSSNTYTITPFNAPGTYTVDHVDVVDKTGNNHTYNTAQLAAIGASTSFVVVDTPTGGSVSINDVSITEGSNGTKVATFTVTRTGGTAAFDVNFATADGSATTADHDYNASSGMLEFGSGVNTQTISVLINGDTKFEPNETFFVNLSAATDGASINDNLGIGTILNDDALLPAGSVSINDVTFAEGNSGAQLATFTVTRSGGIAAFDVNFATADGSAKVADSDYVANIGTLHFGAGVNTQTISVTINGDTKFEPSESFFVNLSGVTNGASISDGQGIGNIQNDDLNRAPRDFNADTTSDVFWRNDATGHTGIWEMHNNLQTWHDLGGSGIDHKVAGIGDFNGDGTADLFWRNDTTGHTGIWEMHNDVPTWHDLGGSGVDHKVVGVGDFNGDGTSDMLWRNDASGHTGFWEMHDSVQTWRDLGGSGTDHKVVGIGDFNGDGTSDVLWRNDSTGHTGFWEMHNNVQTWIDLGGSGTDHKVVGVGDFNGDGTSDILWRNDATGHVGVWEMQNGAQSWVDLGGSGTDHKVAGIGDYNGDGTSDIFWRNDVTGHTGFWEMHNDVPTWHDLGGSGVDHSFIV